MPFRCLGVRVRVRVRKTDRQIEQNGTREREGKKDKKKGERGKSGMSDKPWR